jgi:hypothetical protein
MVLWVDKLCGAEMPQWIKNFLFRHGNSRIVGPDRRAILYSAGLLQVVLQDHAHDY